MMYQQYYILYLGEKQSTYIKDLGLEIYKKLEYR
ncbi:hypothetical protein HNR33_002842 [Brassicibacter mesophilus]